MRWLALFGWLAVGCSFQRTNGTGSGPPGDDDDVPPDGCASYSTQLDTCKLAPGPGLMLSGTLHFDTATGALVTSGGAPVAVTAVTLATPAGEIEAIVAANVTLADDTVLRADGPRPFAMFATTSIVVGARARLDVGLGGAGARTGCGDTPTRGADRDGGGGGGGGGGFGGAGGAGGNGNSDGTTGLGGAGGATTIPLGALGGCAGAAGGNDNNDPGGNGGAGGGAIYLAAGTLVELQPTSSIYAGGGGGQGGKQSGIHFGDAGGGGGGSGGMIFLESPRVVVQGTLAANGGGGGEGSGAQQGGSSGGPGDLGAARASGGSGGSSGGSDGGSGGATPMPGDPVLDSASGGGGGGGGGAGVIWLFSADKQVVNAVISPAAT